VTLKLKRSPEPTNILWQNLHCSKQEIKVRERKMFVNLIVVLAAFFYLLYSYKQSTV